MPPSPRGRKIRVVFVIGPECTGYSRGAKMEDLKLGIADLRHLKRAAVVSDQAFVHNAVRKVRWMVPTKLKLFALASSARRCAGRPRDGARAKRSALYLCAPINALVEGIYRERIPFDEAARARRLRPRHVRQPGRRDGDARRPRVPGAGQRRGARGHGAGRHAVRRRHALGAGQLRRPARTRSTTTASSTGSSRCCRRPISCTRCAWRAPGPTCACAPCPGRRATSRWSRSPASSPSSRFAEATGTLAGFYTPSFLGSLSAPGLHLHFLSDDRSEGGHLLSCAPRGVRAEVQFITQHRGRPADEPGLPHLGLPARHGGGPGGGGVASVRPGACARRRAGRASQAHVAPGSRG